MSEQKTNGQKPSGPIFNVQSVYVKDQSFEAPHSPQIFNEEWKPKINFDLQTHSGKLSEDDGIYEVVLHITVTVKIGEGDKEKTAALIEVKQAGAFVIQNFKEEEVKQVLATMCPTILFPFCREVVSSSATRGGFPQLVLPPINFDAMYAKHLEEMKQKETTGVN